MNYRSQLRNDLNRWLVLSAGLGFFFTGLTIYSNHGFDSKWLFFLGFLMVPIGLLVLGNALVRIPEEF